MSAFGAASYATATLAYLVVAMMLFVSRPAGKRAGWIIAAVGGTALWGACQTVLLLGDSPPLAGLVWLDSVHTTLWTTAVSAWLAAPSSRRWMPARILLPALCIALALWNLVALQFDLGSHRLASVYPSLIIMALLGMLAIEQLFRNADETHRDSLRLLCLGIAGIFAIDVFVYSQAALLEGFVPVFWAAKGFANAALAPLIVIGLKRQTDWENDLFVSRQMVFYTASLVSVGAYLLAMAFAAYLLSALGGEWGLLLELAFLAAALALLLVMIFSYKIKARAKVFLIKHFFRNKYDYREEWLRLTERLGRSGELSSLARNALESIAAIVGSESGGLWLAREDGRYERIATIGTAVRGSIVFRERDVLVSFLARTGWVIDSDQYLRDPALYGTAFGAASENELPPNAWIVPLDRRGYLQGFVVLCKPDDSEDLNFEDHDLLKTAGRQVAAALGQALAQEELSATRQFEAFNKLATFLMHDLKNVIAQQELVVANAKRFKARPEFVEDAVRTVEAGVERMRSIIDRLQNASSGERVSHVNLAKVLNEVCAACSDRLPCPKLTVLSSGIVVDADRDRVAMAITHAVRNAQDATASNGTLEVTLRMEEGAAIVEVADNGAGMTPEFVNERLFKPFDSTKGAKGMGVGAYQIRETFRAAGGDVEVESELGSGTIVRMRLPLAATLLDRGARSVA